MPIATHLIRRGRYYSWRRKAGGLVLQIALGTACPRAARRLAVLLTATSERVWDDMINQQITLEQAIAVIRGAMTDGGFLAAVVGHPAPVREAQEAHVGVDPSIRAVADRLVAVQLRTGAANSNTCAALQKCADLIAEATGVTDIREMRQHHVVTLCEMLDRLPSSYRKSAAERQMTLEQIAEKAEREGRDEGLAVGTVNRTLTNFSMLLKRADAEGLQVDAKLKPTALRRKKNKRSRADRLAFTTDHIKEIFKSPVWQGCHNAVRRHRPGSLVLKDGLYWLPLVAAYTGARREEIAGLMKDDVQEIDGIWCFKLHENEERGVKTEASDRIVPIHPHLIELGILENREREGLFFDGLYRKNKNGPIGECVDYNWRKVLRECLPEKDLDRRCFHSLRHTVIDLLEAMDGVRDRTIKAIVGHTPESITSKVYGSDATPAAMLKAIERLPRVFD